MDCEVKAAFCESFWSMLQPKGGVVQEHVCNRSHAYCWYNICLYTWLPFFRASLLPQNAPTHVVDQYLHYSALCLKYGGYVSGSNVVFILLGCHISKEQNLVTMCDECLIRTSQASFIWQMIMKSWEVIQPLYVDTFGKGTTWPVFYICEITAFRYMTPALPNVTFVWRV